jgi:CBS domain containing-hemolysin-like protein
VDFDEAEWKADALAFIQSCDELGVPVALEISRSGKGAHVWVFFSGSVSIERLKSALEIEDDLPGEEENAFNTLGGFVMYTLGHIPAVSDYFESAGCRFEVVDMDKNRVDKVLVAHIPQVVQTLLN